LLDRPDAFSNGPTIANLSVCYGFPLGHSAGLASTDQHPSTAPQAVRSTGKFA
jgi:hypothetical protein